MVYIYELDHNLCNIGTIFAVKISRKFAKNWWISLDQLLWSTEVNFCQITSLGKTLKKDLTYQVNMESQKFDIF